MFPSGWFLAPAFAGVCLLIFALVLWVMGRRRRSLALRWFSLMFVAMALCAGFAVVGSLASPRMFDFWSDLGFVSLFLAVCAFVVAFVCAIREAMQASGMQRQRS